jgi:uncharacterized spore protein YtfJ
MAEETLEGEPMISEEKAKNGTQVKAGIPAGALAAADSLKNNFMQIDPLLERFGQAARAEACIGPTLTAGGHATFPVATVSLQAGFGMGFGGGQDEAGGKGSGGGGGGGGGGMANSRVVAVVDVSEAGVSVRPVPDLTSIALALLAVIGITVLTTRGRGSGGLVQMIRRQM